MDVIYKLPKVKEVTGLSRSSIYQKIADGQFPKPIRLGIRAVGWLEIEIQEWISQKIKLRGGSK